MLIIIEIYWTLELPLNILPIAPFRKVRHFWLCAGASTATLTINKPPMYNTGKVPTNPRVGGMVGKMY
jgi:hypothetical protein